jgi:hypothetical protein
MANALLFADESASSVLFPSCDAASIQAACITDSWQPDFNTFSSEVSNKLYYDKNVKNEEAKAKRVRSQYGSGVHSATIAITVHRDDDDRTV